MGIEVPAVKSFGEGTLGWQESKAASATTGIPPRGVDVGTSPKHSGRRDERAECAELTCRMGVAARGVVARGVAARLVDEHGVDDLTCKGSLENCAPVSEGLVIDLIGCSVGVGVRVPVVLESFGLWL